MPSLSYDPQFTFSIVFILTVLTLAWIMRLRRTIRSLIPDPNNQVRILSCEVCSTIEKITITYELQIGILHFYDIVLAAHGILVYITFLILVNFWFNMAWESTKSSPLNHVRNLSERKTTWGQVALKLCTEMITGLLVYPLCIKPLWQLYDKHFFRWAKLNMEWSTDLNASVLLGGLIEFSGGLACAFVSKLLVDTLGSSWVTAAMSSCFGAFVVVCGLSLSGSYFDPALASITQFGFGGISIFDHIVVYWAFPIAGVFCGYWLCRAVENALNIDKRTD